MFFGWLRVVSDWIALFTLFTFIIIEYCWDTVGNEIKENHSSVLEFLQNYIILN